MSTEHVTHRLDDYLAGRMTDSARAIVDRHLSECDACLADLRGRGPLDLDDLGPLFDDAAMRQTVRRAIGRTAVDAAAVTVILLVLGVLASLFVVHPLLMNRAGRSAAAARAAYEMPMLFNPGVSLSRLTISWSLLGRTVTTWADLPVGTAAERLDPISSEIGLFGLEPRWSTTTERTLLPIRDVLPGLDDGTVVTVHVGVPAPLSVADAQTLADEPGRDVRLIWAGFDVESSALGQVGYPLCRTLDPPSEELLGASSASFGGTITSGAPSVERAVESAREALAVIAGSDEVASAVAGTSEAMDSLVDAMTGGRSVTSIVVTGPTPEVVGFLDDLGIRDGSVLAAGLYAWGSPLCGR